MNAVQKIAKNTSFLLISQLINYVFGLFIAMYSAQYLGASGLGDLSTALNVAVLFAVFTDLGLGIVTTREVSKDKLLKNKYFYNTAIMRLLLAIFTFGLLILYVTIINQTIFKYSQQTTLLIYIVGLAIILNGFAGTFYVIFQAMEDLKYQSISIILNGSIMLIGTLLAIYYQLNLTFFGMLYVIANLICLLYIIVAFFCNHSTNKLELDFKFMKQTMLIALPFSMVSIFTLIAFRVDILFLSILKPNTDIGWYTAAYKLMEVFLFIPAVFTTSVFPIFSQFYVSSKESLKFTYEKSFKYLMMLSLPVAVGVTILAEPIILLVYKSTFLTSVLIIQILIWTIPITFLNYVFGTIIPAINKQNSLLKITFISMLVNIVLNLIFIPTYSYIGAAVVTIVTEGVVLILCFYIISKSFYKINIFKILYKPMIASGIMALMILTVKTNLFVEIILGIIIYFSALILLKAFDNEDKSIIIQMIPIEKLNYLKGKF
jgi:O-antigen/teichoic acid export membrane protein